MTEQCGIKPEKIKPFKQSEHEVRIKLLAEERYNNGFALQRQKKM